MAISKTKIFPRTGDKQTIYLKNVIKNPNIIVGDYTMYNDFANDPTEFEKNNVLYHYPINHDRLIIGILLLVMMYGLVMMPLLCPVLLLVMEQSLVLVQ